MSEHWSGTGTVSDPRRLKTPPLSPECAIHRDEAAHPALLI